MKLSIIIVNYYVETYLKKCIDSLIDNYESNFKNGEFEIIIGDNGSQNHALDFVKTYGDYIKLIRNNNNLGYAKANNICIQSAQGEYVLLLNPDTIVYKNTLTKLIKYLDEHLKVGLATCRILLPDGSIDDASHRGFPTPWRAFTYFSGLGKMFPNSQFLNGYHLGYQNMNSVHEIEACVGAFMLIRKEVGESLNWLDEDFFWYGEDLDFCYRVKKINYQVMYVPSVSILHYKGIASGIKKHSQNIAKADRKTIILAIKARYEAMRLFYKKHYLTKYPSIVTNFILLAIWIKEKINFLFI
ncbi:MAG: Glycosyl transferase family 2 [Candidatus Gottesmanbacteria bacterium GW2011_GWA1_34_13]|uniref:Glycosyl transferase family 2 n=1 Tax=Candidatus Gottesmanbacteria bacterium GW2011_GWA1_34_13 TaxID=1618434 RepID=A0A0G0DXN4_9BACT|nr:MAG: Glycosyl transferase family 2 [Candidatus Gottesmanbacteria bacterium GW2011_GWA1_34_13]